MPYTNADIANVLQFHTSSLPKNQGLQVKVWDSRLSDRPVLGHYHYDFFYDVGNFDPKILTRQKARELAIERIKKVGVVMEMGSLSSYCQYSELFVFINHDQHGLPPYLFFRDEDKIFTYHSLTVEREKDFYPVYALTAIVPNTSALYPRLDRQIGEEDASFFGNESQKKRQEVLELIIGKDRLDSYRDQYNSRVVQGSVMSDRICG